MIACLLKITSPEEAVMECLKKRAEEPVRIADEAGMPLAVVLEGLLGG
jgi:hypothetical protein